MKLKRVPTPEEQELARIHASGTTDERKVTVVMQGSRYAVFHWPGGPWWDNGGRHYGRTLYCLALKGTRRYSSDRAVVKEWEGRVSKKILAEALKEAESSL